jgi:type II secretory pathway component PulC
MGDFIININGNDIVNIDEIYHILSENKSNKPLDVEVIRRENKFKVNVLPEEKK